MVDTFSLTGKRIWVAGETGLVGQALLRALQGKDCKILHAPHGKLDLTLQHETYAWLKKNKPDAIFMAAAKVGGIGANKAYPADFIRDNLAIAQNVIDGAYKAGVKKLLFLGSSCIYPKMAAQPISEDALMTGPLEETNEAYAIAKIAGLKLCEMYRRQYGCSFISVMPTNLYGPHDRFDENAAHVIPAMMRKFHMAIAEGTLFIDFWGTGTPLREFLHVDDLTQALISLMENYDEAGPVNVGSGEEISIRDLAYLLKDITGFKGELQFNPDMPDGTPRKLLDSTKMRNLGWRPSIGLKTGLQETWGWFLENETGFKPEVRFSASSGR